MSADLATVSHEGLTFDVHDGGPRDGEVVVLLHGFPQDASCWDLVAPRLHTAGLRTLAPDQRGYSPGARPHDTAAYRVDQLVGDVLALLDAAGARRAHVVGHDWGGAVAWAVAAGAPERVASLTVVSTPHPAALTAALRGADQVRRSWYVGAFQVPRLPEVVLSRTLLRTLTGSGLAAEHAARYARRFARPQDLRGPVGWYRAARRQPLPHAPVRVPTTYLWGDRDPFLGRTAAEATGDQVHAPYLFVEVDAGHWLPEEHPDEVAGAVLDRVARSR